MLFPTNKISSSIESEVLSTLFLRMAEAIKATSPATMHQMIGERSFPFYFASVS